MTDMISEGMKMSDNWLSMDDAPRNGTHIEVLQDDGDIDLVYWEENRYCMLGAPMGSFGEGWNNVDNHLPVDDIFIGWRKPS